jgi:nitroreductase
MNRSFLTRTCLVSAALLLSSAAFAQTLAPIELPKPQTTGGMPLMDALRTRASSREFRGDKLPLQVLSNLLWAAFGISRPESGMRTAASSNNRQETDVYAVMQDGAYLYNAKAHRLEPVVAGDLRAVTGKQAYVATAPLNLVYVADYARAGGTPNMGNVLSAGAATGFIGQNVYLYCTSEGLATVIRSNIDYEALTKALKLRPDQKVMLSQTVGYPKK